MISPHFHKPVARFIGDMMYGSMAEKDVKLTSVVRLKERYVKSWKRKVMCGELAGQCRMLYREVAAFDKTGASTLPATALLRKLSRGGFLPADACQLSMGLFFSFSFFD